MAPELAPRGPNESAKEARERRQKAMIEAWSEWDRKEQDARAQIQALDDQGSLNPDQQLAHKENETKRDEAIANKARIEEEWKEEFRCPFKRNWEEIEDNAQDVQDEALIAATNRPNGPEGAAREQIQDLKAQTYMHAAQQLLESHLLPEDLKGGNSQKAAAQLVRPDLAAQLPSPGAQADLEAYADQVQPIYDRLSLGYEAAKDMEKGVVIGKAGETLSEAVRNPSRLGHAFLALAGAGLLIYLTKNFSSNSTFKNLALGAVGVGGLLYGGYGAIKGTDLLNAASGIRSDAPFASESMKSVRKDLEARMGIKESSQVDDMIRTFDAPIENYADAYLNALRNNSNAVDIDRLIGHGLSDKEAGYASKTSIKKNGDWLFMQCYEMGLADGKISAKTDDDAKRAAGAQYAKTEFAGLNVGTIVLARDMVAAGLVAPAEYAVSNPKLRELLDKDAAFRAIVKPTGLPDIYTIKGAPVRFNYTDTGDYVFHDLLNNKDLTRISGKLSGDGLSSTLLRVSDEAGKAMGDAVRAKFPAVSGKLQYKEGTSYWEVEPPLNRAIMTGLSNYEKDRKVHALFYYDAKDHVLRPGLDFNNDGVVDPHEPPLTDIPSVQHEYERKMLEVRVPEDISSTMLVDFKVDDYKDVGPNTEVTISFGAGKGKLIYSGDELTSYTLNPTTKQLEDNWTAAAAEKQVDFLGDPRVQAALLRATTNYTGYDESLIGGLVSKFLGKGKEIVDWVKNDSIANKFASEWEEQVIRKMTDIIYNPVTGFNKLYVDNVFKTFPRNDKFQSVEDNFMNTQITSLEGSGVLKAKVEPLQGPDMDIEWTDLTGLINERARGPIAGALSPLKNEKPTPSSSMSWTVVNGVINFVTQDKVREKQFSDRVDAYLTKLNTDLHALRTPPVKVTQNDLKTAIEKAVYDAQKEAITYWGKNDTEAIKMMMFAPIEKEPHFAEWKQPTELVADYMAGNMKWENYGFLPNAENLAEIMKLWYEGIGNAKTAPASPQEALDYAKFFIWSVWSRMGGVSDYSTDKLFGGTTVSTVSDTLFDENIGMLRATLDKYPAWSGSSSPFKAPAVEGLESNFDVYKEKRIVEMNEWFAKNNDVTVWARIHRWGLDMFKWRTTYEQSYTDRMKDLEARANLAKSESQFYQDTEDFKSFLLVEQKIYQAFIDAGVVPETDYTGISMPFAAFVSVEVTKDWAKYFYASPRDLKGYIKEITQNLGDAMDIGRPFPNFPGIPFWA